MRIVRVLISMKIMSIVLLLCASPSLPYDGRYIVSKIPEANKLKFTAMRTVVPMNINLAYL